jgi:probable HAF family extracellular repeat protein
MRNPVSPALLASLALAPAASGQASFTALPFFPAGVNFAQVYGVSPDGAVAAGGSLVTGGFAGRYGAAMWSEGLINFAIDPAGCSASAAAVTGPVGGGGRVAVGWADYGLFDPRGVQGFVLRDGVAGLIGDFPGNPSPRSSLHGVTADGTGAVGNGASERGTEAFVYHIPEGVFTGLGALMPPGPSFASWGSGISADGSVVVGSSYSAPQQLQAFRWTASGGMAGIPYLTPAPGMTPYATGEAVSADGRVLIGEARSAQSGNGVEAFRWTAAGGTVALGDLPGGAFQSYAYALSADGSVIAGRATIEGPVGPFGGGSKPRAFVWDAANGMRDLQQVLADGGVPLDGWSLQEVRGVSADGTVLAGVATNPAGETQAFIATIPPAAPPACAANCDGSTAPPVLNILDFNCFINRYTAGDPYANCDGSTNPPVLNVLDFNCFVNRFTAGCP